MGNKQSGTAARSSPRPEKPRSEPAKPTYCGWDLEDVNAMIRAGKLAKLRKKCDSDVEAFECPLCFEVRGGGAAPFSARLRLAVPRDFASRARHWPSSIRI